MKIIKVGVLCERSLCECKIFDDANPVRVGNPPFHNECDCKIVESSTKKGDLEK